jgi:hypothetical protein
MSIVKLSNNGVKNATALGSISSLGSMTFIKKITISSPVSSVQFVHGSNGVVLDDTYKEYYFTFNNLHPNSNTEPDIAMNFSTDGGSNYNVTKTTTSFYARHAENNDFASISYLTSLDLAQGTSKQFLAPALNTGNDSSLSGYMSLFNPSSTTFVKHFMINTSIMQNYPAAWQTFTGGYANTTSAINAVSFIGGYNLSTDDNIDAGDICLYGIA